jgi:hypothetical protein
MCLVGVPLFRATLLTRRPWRRMICRAQGISAFNTGLYSFSEDTFAGHGKINRTLTKPGGQICGASRFSSANGHSINGDEWDAIGTAHHADGGLTE